jgi:hypothetical protein
LFWTATVSTVAFFLFHLILYKIKKMKFDADIMEMGLGTIGSAVSYYLSNENCGPTKRSRLKNR